MSSKQTKRRYVKVLARLNVFSVTFSFFIPEMLLFFHTHVFLLLQLLARIERMERRLQLTRKDPPRDKRLFQPLEPWTPDKEDMWDLELESPQPDPATPLIFSRGGKGHKRYNKRQQRQHKCLFLFHIIK